MMCVMHTRCIIRKNEDEMPGHLPLITVITLSYNSEYLYEAMKSVLSQNYPLIQYIISDDGTEEFDKEAIFNFVEMNNKGNIYEVLVLQNEVNLGIVANYNKALGQAKGKYIFPLAADDKYVNENVLYEWTLAFSQTDAPVMCAYCDNYDETMKKFLGRWPRPDHGKLLEKGDIQAIYQFMERIKILPGASMARTLESLQTLGYFDEKYRILEDYPFAMQTLRKGIPIAFWPHSAVMRRGGGVSDANKANPQLIKDMEEFCDQEIYKFSTDPDSLKLYHEKSKRKSMKLRSFQEKWMASGFFRKILLSVRFPTFFARRMYHKLFRI